MMANTTGRRASTASIDDDKDFYDPIDTYGSDHDDNNHQIPKDAPVSQHHPSHPSSPVATRNFYDEVDDDKSKQQQTEGISRRSWEEYDSEDEDQYPVDAYDYGPEESDESDEYEERPSSRRISEQPTAAAAAAVAAATSSPQSPVSPRPLSSRVSQEHRSLSPVQEQTNSQAHFMPTSTTHQHDTNHHSSITQEQYPDESSSPRSSISSDHIQTAASVSVSPLPPSSIEPATSATPSPPTEQKQQESVDKSYRHSYYEEESSEDDQDQYQYGGYDDEPYDSYANQDDTAAPATKQDSKYSDYSESDGEQQQRPASYGAGYASGRESARNSYLNTSDNNKDQRASLSSQRSYSSHTKHHSFGYNDREVEAGGQHDGPSESESEPESESDNEIQKATTAATAIGAIAVAGAAAAVAAVTVAKKRPESPESPKSPQAIATSAPAPPIPSRSRPTSYSATSSIPSSPTMSRAAATAAATTSVTSNAVGLEKKDGDERPKSPVDSRSLRSPRSPTTPRTAIPPLPSPISTLNTTTLVGGEPKKIATPPSNASSVSSVGDQHSRVTRHSSDSDTSGTSIDLQSPSHHHGTPGLNGFGILKSPTLNRTMSSSSTSSPHHHPHHGMANGHAAADHYPNHKGASLEKQRPISYATVFSDAELNDISLDEPASDNKRTSSGAAPKTPSTPSAFGFPSSFFGAKPHPMAQVAPHAPHPPSDATVATATLPPAPTPAIPIVAPTPVQTSPPLPPVPTTSDPRANMVRSASISAVGSSISAAFGRLGSFAAGISSNNNSNNTATATTQQRSSSTTPGPINTSGGIDLRRTSNVSPERASTLSTMTNDSNMDLLLARLEAQNEMLEQDNKRRLAIESENRRLQMEKAIGHAKEESAGESIDWDYWGALMNDYNGTVKRNPKQLTKMIQSGVPPALRGPIWQLLAKSKDSQLEASYAELLKVSSPHEKQIHRDLSRTFPNHEYFQDPEGPGQEALFNVVKAYSLYDTEVGYCQGLSFVVGPLLLNMPDEEAFCVLARMMSSYEMRGHYTPDMKMLQLRLFQYEQLLEECVPFVHRHFQVQGIKSTMYASQWFMTLFAYKFPLDLVFRVFDIVFVEGVEALLRFAVALLKANHDRILGMEFESLVEFLKNGLFETYTNDASMFIQDAYNVKVTPRKLAQYAAKYQALLAKQAAEQAAEESLREQNKQLLLQVKNLEASLSTLNKEHVDLAKEVISNKLEMARLQDDNDGLQQKVVELTKIVDAQGKDVEERFKSEIESVLQKNMEYLHKNQQLEDQLNELENMLIETKMKYAESENERDSLTRKLSDLRRALGVQ